MKSLAQIYEKYRLPEHGISDKGTTHSYIEEYERLFAPYRARQPITMLEIGLCRGGSLRMWHEYFEKSEVYGVDITYRPDGVSDLERLIKEKLPRMTIKVFDASCPAMTLEHIGDTKFDIIIEDASHDIESSACIYANFIHRLNAGGLYVIEDVMYADSFWANFKSVMQPTRKFEMIDLRKRKNRFDDVLVTVR